MANNNELLKEASAILANVASYIAESQPKLDTAAQKQTAFNKSAEKTAAMLVERGLVTKQDAGKLVKKFASDNTEVFKFIESLAKRIGPEQMGKEASDVARRLAESTDPFTQMILEEDGMTNTAMVD